MYLFILFQHDSPCIKINKTKNYADTISAVLTPPTELKSIIAHNLLRARRPRNMSAMSFRARETTHPTRPVRPTYRAHVLIYILYIIITVCDDAIIASSIANMSCATRPACHFYLSIPSHYTSARGQHKRAKCDARDHASCTSEGRSESARRAPVM